MLNLKLVNCNKKGCLVYILALGTSILVTSCATLYKPTMQHTPLIKEKNELNANVSLSNLQVSYAPTNHLALMIGGAVYGGEKRADFDGGFLSKNDYYYNNKGAQINAAIGYYSILPEGFTWNIFGGGGLGRHRLEKIKTSLFDSMFVPYYEYREFETSVKSRNLFIQPTIGYSTPFLEYSFSWRVSLAQFHSIATSYDSAQVAGGRRFELRNSPFVTFDPAFTFRGGYKYVKGFVQVLYTISSDYKGWPILPLQISMGIHFTLANRYKP